jgi:hypothetical protein
VNSKHGEILFFSLFVLSYEKDFSEEYIQVDKYETVIGENFQHRHYKKELGRKYDLFMEKMIKLNNSKVVW